MSETDKTIQERMTELSEIIQWFQSDDFTLEEAVGRYKAAEELAVSIEGTLNSLKNDIQVIKQSFDETA